MGSRKIQFENGEFYHIYNRGVDKRVIFSDREDIDRFYQSMVEFNVVDPIGSLFENSFRQLGSQAPKFEEIESPSPLVRLIAYCLNPNHYHLLVQQVVDRGIEKLMQKIGTGFTNYFNNKNDRSGSLFQGKFKAALIDSNEYLLHTSVYVNLNDQVHQLGSQAPKLVASVSSWKEYEYENIQGICSKDIILDQFKNRSEYKEFATSTLQDILDRRSDLKEFEKMFLE